MATFHSPILENLKQLVNRAFGRGARSDAKAVESVFRGKYVNFQELLESNGELLKIVSQMEDNRQGTRVFGMAFLHSSASLAVFHCLRMVQAYEKLSGEPLPTLHTLVRDLGRDMQELLRAPKDPGGRPNILEFEQIFRQSVDEVGGKSANLGEVRNRVGLPVPDGFAVTCAAFRRFLAQDDLAEEIAKRALDVDSEDPASLQAASEDIQFRILRADLPEGLAEELLDRHAALARRLGQGQDTLRVALRSSALGEDGELSFAGQYLSILGVTRDKLVESYKYVAASLFTPRAMAYRLQKGVPDEAAAMGVACLAMVPSRASGVLYTRHPFDPADRCIHINAVWGLGPYAVDGVVTPDVYVVDPVRLDIVSSQVASQDARLECGREGGLTRVAVEPDQAGRPCLEPEQVRTLAEWGRRLAEHYGSPQDVEWALDPSGRFVILQSRPLALPSGENLDLSSAGPPLPGYTVLLEGGQPACPGVGAGPVSLVRTDEDLAAFPQGAVLVAAHSSPKFVLVMRKAAAIVADHGSVTGHMASLAREFDVPTLLGLERATAVLPPGEVVTVDALGGRIYQGLVDELVERRVERPAPMRGTAIMDLLRRVSALVAPLNLLDPNAPEFSPQGCRTLHDVARYLHERSYSAMFALGDMAADGGAMARRLKAGIGLDLYVIDLGGALAEGAGERSELALGDVVSRPFLALMRGLADQAYVASGPRPVQLRGFLSVMGRQMVNGPQMGAERFGDKSYVIASDKYLNFSSRVGYHYGVLDCYLGQSVSKNYVTFSFKGGAAGEVRRERRARAIARILSELGFAVSVTGDRVQGRYLKYPPHYIEDQLVRLGRLLQFTRQTDMLMTNEASVEAMVASFLRGDAVFEGADPPDAPGRS